ncbi:MAG: efflux RND transporter periplasmic adaptor subunit [Pseudomonadales bacterium]|nr:efflux RND transporter periplasmic adaptor subunit [Pseudomonadales bacterium]NRA14725.1 efflux RND transporter periplasmic adaptor subunit [Oceanospirillaceae bacterium]
MQITIKNFSVIAIFAAATLIFSGCADETAITTEKITKIWPAKILTLELAKSEHLLSYPAVIDSSQLSVLAFEIGGLINELPIIEAQKVQKGDLLAKLDQADLNIKLQSAKAKYSNSNKEYQRAARLIKSRAISRSELEKRRSTRDVDKASFSSAAKALADSVLVAPFSGNIAKVAVKLRQVVQPGEAAVTILGTGGLEATFNLPSSIIARATADTRTASGSYITVDAAPLLRIPAMFKEVSLQADVSSQTHEVTFSFEAPENLIILPGMNALVWFKDPSLVNNQSKIMIPLTAIAIDGQQKYVWVVEPESMQVTRRNISLVSGVGETLAVAKGLQVGEMIVGAGVSYLSQGMIVRPWSIKP